MSASLVYTEKLPLDVLQFLTPYSEVTECVFETLMSPPYNTGHITGFCDTYVNSVVYFTAADPAVIV